MKKIEQLTNAWYGFAVFTALYSVVTNGVGFFTLVWTTAGLLFSWFLTFLIGRALLRRSSLTRTLLLLVSALSTVLGALSAGRAGLNFVSSWELGVLLTGVYSAASMWMNAKSFRTLTDSSVKAYFR